MSKVHEGLSPSTYENLRNLLAYRTKYWGSCRRFVDMAGAWVGKVKFLEGLKSPNPSLKQLETLKKYYKNDPYRVTVATGEAYQRLEQAFYSYRRIATVFGFKSLELEDLLRLVIERKDRGKFKRYIDKHLRDYDEPFPFEQIPERDFRSR